MEKEGGGGTCNSHYWNRKVHFVLINSWKFSDYIMGRKFYKISGVSVIWCTWTLSPHPPLATALWKRIVHTLREWNKRNINLYNIKMIIKSQSLLINWIIISNSKVIFTYKHNIKNEWNHNSKSNILSVILHLYYYFY